jgi:hypothetical protein
LPPTIRLFDEWKTILELFIYFLQILFYYYKAGDDERTTMKRSLRAALILFALAIEVIVDANENVYILSGYGQLVTSSTLR